VEFAGCVSGIAPDGSPVGLYALLPERGEGELVAGAIPAGTEILELGAGTGRVTRQLVARGYRVVAVDQSAEMLAYVEGAEAVRADIETLDLGRPFGAVLLASNLVNTESPEVRRAFLATCRRHLADDGLVVIEGLPLEWEPPNAEGRIGEIATRLTAVRREGDVVRGAVEYERGPDRWRHSFAMRVFDEPALRAALAEVDLRLERWLDERRAWLVARAG